MKKRPSGTISSVLRKLRRSGPPIFVTSVLYRAIAFVILAPMASALARLFLKGSGRIVVSNDEIASFVLEPLGIAALIVMGSVGLSLFALEQACLMTLFHTSEQKALWQAVDSLKRVLGKSLAILELAGRIVVQILIIATPFLTLALLIFLFFLGEHDINFYLTRQPPVFKWALAGGLFLGIGLAVSLVIYAARVLFALPILMFEDKNPKSALKDSAARSSGHRLRIAKTIAIWAIATLVVAWAAGAAFIWLGKLIVPLVIGYIPLLVILLGGFFLVLSLTQLLINIFSTAGFSVLIMILYEGLNSVHQPSKLFSNRDHEKIENRQIILSGRFVFGGSVLLAIAACIAGWWLLSNVEIEDRTRIIAHRGSSHAAPENTLAAVQQAIDDKAHWVEIDVQRTADDKVVVVHDRDLLRIGGRPMVVTRTDFAELAQIDIGSWFDPAFADQRLPGLKEVLDICRGHISVKIELKYYQWDEELAQRVITIVEQAQMADKVVIMSLNIEAVNQIKRERPHWKAGLLTAASLGELAKTPTDFLAVHSRMATPGFVRRIQRAGKQVMVWTVNDTAGMTQYFGMNVDGLITDKPALAIQLLEQRADMDPIEKTLLTLGLIVMGESEHVDPETDGI